jgi:hypothetical protein
MSANAIAMEVPLREAVSDQTSNLFLRFQEQALDYFEVVTHAKNDFPDERRVQPQSLADHRQGAYHVHQQSAFGQL